MFHGTFTVKVMEDMESWNRDLVRIIVRQRDGYNDSFLMSDGTWTSVPEGSLVTGEVGISLPRAALEPFVKGIEEWQGHTNHSDTEARVLREWLRLETDRVNGFLTRGDKS